MGKQLMQPLCWRDMNKGKGGRAKAPKRGKWAERVISDKPQAASEKLLELEFRF